MRNKQTPTTKLLQENLAEFCGDLKLLLEKKKFQLDLSEADLRATAEQVRHVLLLALK